MVPPLPMNMPTPRRSSSNRVTGGAAGCWAHETFRDKTAPATPAVDEKMNCLRFMLSSGTRNSILDWLLAATLALAAISGLAGIDADFGGVRLRSHSAWRVLAPWVILVAIRIRLGIGEPAAWLFRLAMLTAIALSAGTWLRFLLTTIGGADSYGYVSAAEMLRSGRLSMPAPLAESLPVSHPQAVAAPLGWAPAPDGSGLVPAYPLGLPLVMALFGMIGGGSAVFLVAPVFAAVTLLLVYRYTRAWFDADTALVAAALVACHPVFVTYAKQPMSDVVASAWVMAALVLALGSSPARALGAGLAAGLAVMTRPVLLLAALPLLGVSASRRIDLVMASAGLGLSLLIQVALQARFFGNPFATGYGSAEALFSPAHVITNLGIFAHHGWATLGAVGLGGLLIGAAVAPRRLLLQVGAVAVAVMLPYAFYLPFDHWETLRYLLPAVVPLLVIAAAGLMGMVRRIPNPHVSLAVSVMLVAAFAMRSEALLRQFSVWEIQSVEARYPLAGQWFDINTPPTAVALANQHSGSLRWYGRRETVRWDLLAPGELVPTVRALEARGAPVYAALEGIEVEQFESRFASEMDQLQIDHVGRVGNVHFRRLTSRAGSPAPGSSSP
jgi:hypothetical protein